VSPRRRPGSPLLLGAVIGLIGLLAGSALLFANSAGTATVLRQAQRRQAMASIVATAATTPPVVAAVVLVAEAHASGLASEADAAAARIALSQVADDLAPGSVELSPAAHTAVAALRADVIGIDDSLTRGNIGDAVAAAMGIDGPAEAATDTIQADIAAIDAEMTLLSDDIGILLDGARFMVAFLLPAIGLLLFWKSLNRRHRAESLEAARAGEHALAESRRSLIASLSHELRTPLTSLVGFAEELRDRSDLGRREQDELTAIIAEQAVAASLLCEDLITAARLDADDLTIRAEPIDLRLKAERVARSLGWGIRPHLNIRVTGSAVARADHDRVGHVLRLLLTNAIEHGGDRIVVTLSTEGDRAAVSVSDNGPGIPETEIDRMFDPFETGAVDPAQTKPLGLGLSIARALARFMGGDVAYSRAGGITDFRLLLPAVSHEELPTTDPASIAA